MTAVIANRREHPRWRLIIALLLPLAIAAPAIWALSTRAPELVTTPLTPSGEGRIAVPIELSYLDYPGSGAAHVARLDLHLGEVSSLARRQMIEMLVASYDTAPLLESADLLVVGTECRFRTVPRSTWLNNDVLAFVRGRECLPLRGSPTGKLELSVHFRGPGRVGLWTYRPDASIDPSVISLPDPSWSDLGLQVELRGNYVDWAGQSHYRRADLLAYVWTFQHGSLWVWSLLASGIALMGLAVVAMTSAPGQRLALKAAAGGFLWCAGLSILYVVVVPPFQAPDEPSHFLGYGYVTGNQTLQDEAARWGWLAHGERLRGHPEERFRPSDIGHPYLVNWHLVSPVGFERSSITVPGWQLLSRGIGRLPAARQFLILRLVNAVMFGLAVALAAALVAVLTPALRPSAWIAIMLVVPTLPFFASYVSNYAPGISAYVLMAAACVILVVDGPRASVAGFPLGIGLALAATSTRSGLPMIVMTLVVAGVRVVLGDRTKRLLPAAIFWAGMLAGALAMGYLLTEQYRNGVVVDVTRLGPRTGRTLAFVFAHPLLGLAAVSTLALWLEVLSARARRRWAGSAVRLLTPVIAPVCLAGIVAIAAMLAASLFLPFPHLRPNVGASTLTTATYAMDAVAAAITPFRLADPDFLLFTTFWGAFGWVDTVLPDTLLSLLAAGSALATAVLLYEHALTRDVRRFCWLIGMFVALTATVAAYAAAARWIGLDLHGRYLIGPYLVGVAIAWSSALGAGSGAWEGQRRWDGAVAAGAWTIVGIGHSCALATIVTRYF